ncbi:MAG: hypothetical protein QM820_44185 [Minicystis sp.]
MEPTSTLSGSVRLDGGATVPVLELSDGLLRIGKPADAPKAGAHWSGVLITPSGEVPVSGTVDAVDGNGVLIKLDLLIEAYAAILRDYLTRVQMLDFVV